MAKATTKTVSAPAVANVPNIFAPGATFVAPAPKKPASKEKPTVDLGTNLDQVTACSVLIKCLESTKAMLESEVKEKSLDAVIGRIILTNESPVSMLGYGPRSTASVQMRRNGSNRALSIDVLEMLKSFSIPFESNVAVPERFVFNPSLTQDQLIKINAVIMADKDMQTLHAFTPIVVKQEEESINVATDGTISGIAKLSADLTKIGDDTAENALNHRAVLAALLGGTMTMAFAQRCFDNEKVSVGDVVSIDAKAIAVGILQEMGDLPAPEVVSVKKKKKVA